MKKISKNNLVLFFLSLSIVALVILIIIQAIGDEPYNQLNTVILITLGILLFFRIRKELNIKKELDELKEKETIAEED